MGWPTATRRENDHAQGRKAKCQTQAFCGAIHISFAAKHAGDDRRERSPEQLLVTKYSKVLYVGLPDSVCMVATWNPYSRNYDHVRVAARFENPIHFEWRAEGRRNEYAETTFASTRPSFYPSVWRSPFQPLI